ncbi:hypothetical protein FACS189499_07340 [Clostridia bacterium]|nr:hypothetical protein FACS189499_07340 [Clostridia bacterium]
MNNETDFTSKIKMIEVARLKSFEDNFYSMSEIETLADDIGRQGLKHNIVVYKSPDSETYTIISGHRRVEAVKLLIENGQFAETALPRYVTSEKYKSATFLDLVMLNKTSRIMSNAELMREHEVLKQVFDEQKLNGNKLNGRTNENIAKMLGVSERRIAKIENIKNNAIPEIVKAVENNEISINKASDFAELDKIIQTELTRAGLAVQSAPIKEITADNIKSKKKTKKSQKEGEMVQIAPFFNSENIEHKAVTDFLNEKKETALTSYPESDNFEITVLKKEAEVIVNQLNKILKGDIEGEEFMIIEGFLNMLKRKLR